MKRRKREIEVFNLSFLDVISCGFGAVILLLVVALAFEPTTVRTISKDLGSEIDRKDSSRARLVEETQALGRALAEKKAALADVAARVSALSGNWEKAQKETASSQAKAREQSRIEQQVMVVQQSLTEEMKRLLSRPDHRPPGADATIGGLPVDSEYIIFIIDTSGSMKYGAWPLVMRKIEEILSVYPKVKGLQVLSDMGNYMFPSYRGQWIPDTPERRAIILKTLRGWNTFSNSSPVEGILAAVQTFYRPNRPTSIFVFGDDFNGPNIDDVVTAVARTNRKNAAGQTQIRIHTMGFPVLALLGSGRPEKANFVRFAHLMRVLAEQNSGSFVGLNSLR